MEHSFDIEIAQNISIEAAILYKNIIFWVEKNKANEDNFFDDRFWTYNSIDAFVKLFPYMTKHKINKALKDLEDADLIITGNYNKSSYDRTKWYSVLKDYDIAKIGNGSCLNNKTIPDSKPDSKPNDKQQISETLFSEPIKQGSSVKKQSEEAEYKSRLMTEAGVSEEAVNEYIVLRKRKKASLGKIAATRLIKEIKKCPLPPDEIIGKCLERGWVGFEASWLMPKPQNNNFGGNNNGGNFDVNNPGFQTNR